MSKITVQVEFKDHESIVLTRGNGDTYTSKSSELMDFFHTKDVESPVPDKVEEAAKGYATGNENKLDGYHV